MYLSDAGVEAARDAAALARLVAEGDLDAVDGERRLRAVRSPVLPRVRAVQLRECLREELRAVAFHLRGETIYGY